MSGFDLTSPVVLELRAARPRAPEALREQILARCVFKHKTRFVVPSWFTVRRVALVAVPVCLAVAVGGALIHGVLNAGSPQTKAAPTTPTFTPPVPRSHDQTLGPGHQAKGRSWEAVVPRAMPGAVLPPSKTRLQDYRASLTLRVDGLDDLSSSTQKAIRITRGVGGYVVSARYGAEKEGLSSLVVRVPVDHVQQAIARFSQLGKITAQDIHIRDLQASVNELGRRIDALRVRIAKIDDRLADPSLSSAERVRLELRRARLARTLHALTAQRAHTVRRAQFATVSLTLTTHEAVIVKPHHRGPLGRALDDAGAILAKEAAWGLYALIVVGPLLILAALAVLLVRTGRRYSDRRLLESS